MNKGRKSKYAVNDDLAIRKWNAALYLRLSSEDGDKVESTSIESQKHLLEEFLKNNNDIKLFDYYIDDGYSGTDFNRPGFKKLFEDMKLNKFNTIIVKDLSRLGRNYIEAGNYIEQIFPLFNIRFIAVIDNIDSYLNPKSINELNMPLKNLINDEYARDISKKVSSAFSTMRKNGLYTSGLTPYGYKRDTKDKHHLIIDEEVANNVKLIYDLYLKGNGIKKIAKYLNENKIINPSGYRKLNKKDTNRLGYFWSDSTISKILDNQIYCGDMVQGKTYSISYKVHKKIKKDKENWDIVKDTHEPIINKDVWEKVHQLRMKSFIKVSIKEKEKSLFAGKLKCADCGYAMRRQYRKNSKDKITFNCSTYLSRTKDICKNHYITENILKKIVWNILKQQLKLFINNKNIEKIKNDKEGKNDINLYCKEMDKENENLNKYKKMKVNLYEDWKLNIISEEEYKEYLKDYTDKIVNSTKNIKFLENKINETKKNYSELNEKKCIKSIENFINEKELTLEMVDNFIDYIEVYENNNIKINFKFRDEYKDLLNQLKEVSYEKKI